MVRQGNTGFVVGASIFAATMMLLKASNRLTQPVTTSLSLRMGWLIVIAAEPLFARVPASGLLWMVAGGLAYTIGVVFFALDPCVRYDHLIWPLFVMAGTACDYFAVAGYAD